MTLTIKAITPRQADTLRAIINLAKKNGVPPTLRELAAALGVSSTHGVALHLQALVDKGFIARDGRKARSIRVLTTGGRS